jgi:hypothetical protein
MSRAFIPVVKNEQISNDVGVGVGALRILI